MTATTNGSGRIARLIDALDERTGIRAARSAFLGRTIPGAPSFGRALGAAVGGLFLLEMMTGLALALIYSPSTTDAWASVATIQTVTPLGSLIRGIHYFGTSVLLITAGLHLAHIVATAAYRRPNEVAWVVGVIGLLLIPAFAITGNVLPNDQDGYWGFQVELAIIGDAPFGGVIKKVLLGGEEYGNGTLTRLNAIHTLVLPGIFIGLAVLHVVLARRKKAAPGELSTPAFPGQVSRNVIMTVLVVGITFGLALALPNRLDAPADPASAFTARPEWYFMALNQMAGLFGSDLAFLGTLVLPTLAVLFLVGLPFLDRKGSGRPPLAVLVPFALIGVALVGLTAKGLIADAGNEKLAKQEEHAAKVAAAVLAGFATSGVDSLGRVTLIAGERLYHEKGCAACHDDEKKAAPRLAGWNTLERMSAFLENPDSPRFYGKGIMDGDMTAFEGSVEERTALATWILSLGGVIKDPKPELVAKGREVFKGDSCTTCHNDPLVSLRDDKNYDLRAVGPDLDGYGSAEWTRGLLRDAGHPRYFGDTLSNEEFKKGMPAYPDLTDDDLTLLGKWLAAGAPGAK